MSLMARYPIFWGYLNLTIPLLLGIESFLLFFIIINNFITINDSALKSLVACPMRGIIRPKDMDPLGEA